MRLLIQMKMKIELMAFWRQMCGVANALANQHLFEKPSFMNVLDLETMHAPKFFKYTNEKV
ncbi:hypothetical protein AHAS_Ahas14G0160900 [Arachis hypogaea]